MQHTYTKTNMSDKLIQELAASSIKPKLQSIAIDSDSIVVVTEILDSTEQAELDLVISSHDHTVINMNKHVEQKILSAMDFGKSLMCEYGARNTLAGRTVAEVRAISDKLNDLQTLLLSGSLHVALDEISNVVPDTLVTQADMDEFTLKIQKFLGI